MGKGREWRIMEERKLRERGSEGEEKRGKKNGRLGEEGGRWI
jgi:hypothetical protein